MTIISKRKSPAGRNFLMTGLRRAVLSELDIELLTDFGDVVLLGGHDGVEDREDGVEDELVEGTF